MNWNALLRPGLLLFVLAFVCLDYYLSRRLVKSWKITTAIIPIIAVAFIILEIFIWYNHATFPLNLETMEGVILQHFKRAANFQPIYIQPSPSYVPLSYNPLYYEVAIPLSWILGVNLFTLRLVSILGVVGSNLILYKVVNKETSSRWWGIMAVGLFAAAYKVMDVYLDTAHSDLWFLFTALLGSYVIYRNRSRWWNLVGVLLLVASFWFKQHGALFAVGGVLYLTWREGPKKAWIYWMAAALLGPIVYLFAGSTLFGPYFHYFTWEVPSRWSELNVDTFRRYFSFILGSYPVMATAGLVYTIMTAFKNRRQITIWETQLVFAMLTGLMGALDPGSSNNVFIPMGTFFILVGSIGLYKLSARMFVFRHYGLHHMGILITFAVFLFNPFTVIVSKQSNLSFQDLIGTLQGLNGNVYAPFLGQLQSGYNLYPAAHWVALEDMVRGPGRDEENQPLTREMLDPVINPQKPTFILSNNKIERMVPAMRFLSQYYVLEKDFGERFMPLTDLPHRWNVGWPRYLYRYDPSNPVLN